MALHAYARGKVGELHTISGFIDALPPWPCPLDKFLHKSAFVQSTLANVIASLLAGCVVLYWVAGKLADGDGHHR
jgi:hypothetical protein